MAKFKSLKVGDKLSESQYYTVVKISSDRVQLKNDLDEDIVVGGSYVEKCLIAADQFTETKKVSKTEAAQIFLSSPSVAMTVNFNKQVKEADVVKELMEAYEGSTVKTMEQAIKKSVKSALAGEERTMVGRHEGSVDEFGRIHFTDMEIEKTPGKDFDSRHRLVDPRTINWLIVRNVKYIVK
jgi:hypothetical protein